MALSLFLLDNIKALSMYNLNYYNFHHFGKTLPQSLACIRWNQCRMQKAMVEEKGVGSRTAAVHVGMHSLSGEECTETLGHCSLAGGLCQRWLSTTGSPFCF